uniref:Uncharacterized protein n=1 Tax=Arundo donax TaxID=35708 RepID=A0A0A8Y6Q0_ARUDO
MIHLQFGFCILAHKCKNRPVRIWEKLFLISVAMVHCDPGNNNNVIERCIIL